MSWSPGWPELIFSHKWKTVHLNAKSECHCVDINELLRRDAVLFFHTICKCLKRNHYKHKVEAKMGSFLFFLVGLFRCSDLSLPTVFFFLTTKIAKRAHSCSKKFSWKDPQCGYTVEGTIWSSLSYLVASVLQGHETTTTTTTRRCNLTWHSSKCFVFHVIDDPFEKGQRGSDGAQPFF